MQMIRKLSGILAVSLIGCGLATLPGLAAQDMPWTSFTQFSIESGLPAYAVPNDMLEDSEGYIWLAYESGLYRYDGYAILPVPASLQDSTHLAEFAVNTLFQDRQHRVWVGTQNLGVSRYDPVRRQFDRLLPASIGGVLPAGRIWDIWQADAQRYWLATETGLVRWDDTARAGTLYTYPDTLPDATAVAYINTIRCIVPDMADSNRLWLGTRNGLWSFDIPSGRFFPHRMPYQSAEIGLLPYAYMILDLVAEGDSVLWAGTWGGGLMAYHIRTGRWDRFRNARVPPDRDIFYHVSRFDDTTLCVGTTFDAGFFSCSKGVFSFIPRDASITGGNAYNQYYGAAGITADGYFMALSSVGLRVSVMAREPSEPAKQRRPLISRLEIHQEDRVTIDPLAEGGVVRLNRKDAYLLGEITRPAARANQEVEYRHRLRGYDPDWVMQGRSRSFQYAHLPPGRYTLAYAARVQGGEWVSGSAPLTIAVILPWWQRTGAWVMLMIVLILAAIPIVAWRVRQIRRESRMRETFARRLAENEMTALRAQMNPHFLFNSLNSIKNFILRQDTDRASHYLNQFSRLMRSILQNSSRTFVPLSEEIDALRLYIELEAMRLDEGFSVQWTLDPTLDIRRIMVPPLLIQPYVENAIWHGLMPATGDRRLFLTVRREVESLLILIRDNGVGRAASRSRGKRNARPDGGMGMRITRDRIDLLRQTQHIAASVVVRDLTAPDGAPAGTEVIIQLPLRNASAPAALEDQTALHE